MEQWEQIIVEWINCLDILQEPVENTRELQDGIFYINVLNLISWTKHKHNCNQENIITTFMEDEYPSFKINKDDSTEHIYIVSLLLVYTSQTTMFHIPMCNKLKHETQIRIKIFLENILPLGSDITRDTMKEVIVELIEDASRSPSNHYTPPLKDFVKSPIMRSAHSSYKIMTERTRELRELRYNLDEERFKNAELQDEIKIYQEKIQNLKVKLETKTTQFKALREEQMTLNTPQPSYKKECTSLHEDYYKKYINDLEIQLSKQQDEMDNLENEKDNLSKTLACTQRQSIQYKKSLVNCERSLETLSRKIETKDRELIELRMHNEEIRVRLKELNKNSVIEQSFEVEDSVVSSLSARMSLNNSEVLSSVIEIQLQEAKEESAILQAQVDSLKGKLDIFTKNYKETIELNEDLQQKVKILDKVQTELNDVQKELHASNTDIKNLQVKKESLIARNEELECLLLSKENELSETVQLNTALNTKSDNLKIDMENLNKLFENEKTNSLDLSNALEQIKSQVTEHLTHIHKLTDEKDSYKSCIDACKENVKTILNYGNQFIDITDNLDNMTLNELLNYFNVMILNYNSVCTSYKYDISKLKETIDEINANLHNQQLTIATLREQNHQTLTELANIEEDRKQKDLLLNEQKETIHKYSQEIEILKEIANEKHGLEEDVRKLTKDLINQQLLSKSLITYFRRFQDTTKYFKLMKQETQQRFTEYQENIKIAFERIDNNCQTLHHELCNMEQEKEELKNNLNHTKKELSDVQVINTMLQQDLLQYQDKVNNFEEIDKFLCNDLNESKQNIQKLQETNRTLEEQYAILKIESYNNLESLKLENTKISLELKDTIDKFKVLQQKMEDTMVQMELKNTQINELLSDVSSLKAEKDHLISSNEEMFVAKNKEMELKEKTLLMLQNKMETLMNEASESEKKMKEIIINLQEVRSSQDAVLATQETALKEKCLHIKELEEQFSKTKEVFKKELENERMLHRELQVKFSELEGLIHDRNKTIEELQEKLEVMNTELEMNKDHCKFMDASQANIVKLCQELEHPTKNLNSTIMEICSDFDDILDQTLYDPSQYECSYKDIRTENIINIIKMTLHELHLSQKVISHLSFTNVDLNKTLEEQKILIENSKKDKEEICSLTNKMRELEIIAQKRNEYLNNIIKSKESLKDFIEKYFTSRNDLDAVLSSSLQKWSKILSEFQNILHTENPACDQFRQLQTKKTSVEKALSKYRVEHLENIKCISDILWKNFLWTEKKLHDTYLCSVHKKECLDILKNVEENQFTNEKVIIDAELEKNKALSNNILKSEEEIQSFTALATSYENGLKSGEVKTQSDIDKKLQNEINQLAKEKKDLKNKLDSMRSRNVKLERNMDDLRMELKKLNSETESTADSKDVQSLKDELERVKEQNQQIQKEKESSKTTKQEFENQLKEVHTTYEQKLEDMKQKMKKAYNEQVEKIVREKLQNQMESMCHKQREEINKYKTHVGELSSQLWSVGEKLLIEQQQKQDALQRLKEVQAKFKEVEIDQNMSTISRRTAKLEKQEVIPESIQQTTHKVTMITEETFQRRHSVRNLQTMGNAFKAEDEEEVFDNVYLADMKRGFCLPSTDVNRLSILQMRNAQCKPHLKSSYPAEMQFLPSSLTEEEIKSGSITEENFNDSLSQSLLPEQKTKKKDRSQTSYKKPGPPTPSKNGGRLSLQGNELRSPSSRILKERNADRRTTTTPHSLKYLFTLKRQDENATGTPKNRRLSSIFRKSRMQ